MVLGGLLDIMAAIIIASFALDNPPILACSSVVKKDTEAELNRRSSPSRLNKIHVEVSK